MFVISVLAIIIQMLLTVDIRLVLGETATALVGGILYASIMCIMEYGINVCQKVLLYGEIFSPV